MLAIINPREIIKEAIPEIATIGNYGNAKTIGYDQWYNRMKSIETLNLKKYNRSTSWVSLQNYFDCIIESNSNYNTITFNEAKYKLIRKYVMSEEFNKKSA